MYTIRQDSASVRDHRTVYGDGHHPGEPYAGAGVLDDLPGADARDLPLILARFAVLRAWALRSERAEAVVVAHAVSAAHAHLAAVEVDWGERDLLRSALHGQGGEAALASLNSAAAAAEAIGHVHGARALRQAVHRERLYGGWLPPRSRS